MKVKFLQNLRPYFQRPLFKFIIINFLYLGVLNPHKHKNTDLLRLHGIAYETILENDDDQVNGVVHFVDGAGVSFPFLTLFTPREAIRVAKNGEVQKYFYKK